MSQTEPDFERGWAVSFESFFADLGEKRVLLLGHVRVMARRGEIRAVGASAVTLRPRLRQMPPLVAVVARAARRDRASRPWVRRFR